MVAVALLGAFLGLVLSLGTTGRLIYLGMARYAGLADGQGPRSWKRTAMLLGIGVVLLAGSCWYVLHLFGGCNNALTC